MFVEGVTEHHPTFFQAWRGRGCSTPPYFITVSVTLAATVCTHTLEHTISSGFCASALLEMGGTAQAHMRRTAMALRVAPSLEEMRKPCALRVPGSSAIGGKRVTEEVLLTTAPPLSFPSPNQHSTLWSTLLHTGCIM